MQGELFVPDQLLPSDNGLEIPSLRLDMQPIGCDIPFVCFGEQKRTYKMNGSGTLHFYTDDYRYGNALYEHPEKILLHNPANIVEPNYSMSHEMPVAFALQAIYKKRFIARVMQDKGIRVFVDLNVDPKFYKLNLIGVPMGYSAFCTRGSSDRLELLEIDYEIANTISNGNRLLFVVYGGGEQARRFCQKNNAIYVTPIVHIKDKARAIEKLKDTVAFFGQPLEIDANIPTLDKMLEYQIKDYTNNLNT